MDRKKHIVLIFLVSLAIFSLPTAVRWVFLENPSIIGYPTYMHTRIAGYMASGDFDWYDPLSFGGREYTYPPFFSFTLGSLSHLMPVDIAGVGFLAFFGGISAVSMYLIARKLVPKANIAVFMLILTPGIIYLFSHLSSRSPSVALSLLSLYILLSGRFSERFRYVVSGVLLGAASLFHIEVGVVFGMFFLFLLPKNRKIPWVLLLAAIVSIIWYAPFFLMNGLPEINEIHLNYMTERHGLEPIAFGKYFFETSHFGYLTFVLAALAIIGFKETKNDFLRYWAVFAFALSLLAERFLIYLPLPLVLLSAVAIQSVLKKNIWKRTGRALVIIALAYIFFFGAYKIYQFSNEAPSVSQYDAFLWLRSNTPENSAILSGWEWGHWISGIAERKNFIDGYAEYVPDASKRLKELNIFYRDCKIPQGYNISYVYVEDWFAQEKNIQCLYNLDLVYNRSGSKIFRI